MTVRKESQEMSKMRKTLVGVMGLLWFAVTGVGPVGAADVVLYEVTEAVRLGKSGSFKSSTATLSGVSRVGTVICPDWFATQLGLPECTVTVNAIGKADDVTGVGPASGTFNVLIQDANNVDAPE